MIITDRTDASLSSESVDALTHAALRGNADGTAGGFYAQALAATVENVEGPAWLVPGTQPSGISSSLTGLAQKPARLRCDDRVWFRTHPLVIHLNVAQLVEDGRYHPGLMGLDEAIESLGSRHESAVSEQDLDAWDRDIDLVTDRYTIEYGRYARRFTIAAHAIAECVPGLSAEVSVLADADPNSAWWSTAANCTNRQPHGDQLAMDIWGLAHDVTPLPNVDLWLGQRRAK